MTKGAKEITYGQALAKLQELADTDSDEAKVKGIREWVCRKLNVPFHEELDKVKS